MEVFRRSVPTQTRVISFGSALSPTPSPTALHGKFLYKPRITHFKPFQNRPFATINSNRKYLRIMAALGRLARRRNSLRKKLDQDKEVPQISQESVSPINHVVDSQASEPNMANSGSQQGSGQMGTDKNDSESINEEKSNSAEEPVLWNELEGWAEQYEKDVEFWGIGWEAIFTVYEDSEGNVEQVLVDEEEILRRSGVNPLYFRENRESEEFSKVNSKISHAKFLASEMESGKHVIPRNSSVAKFVAAGRDSGFLSRIRSVSIPPGLVPMPNFSRIGVVLVCGFLFLWAMKKLFSFGGNTRVSRRLKKEMLRRKIQSRMEKEQLQKRNAKIVEEASEGEEELNCKQDDQDEQDVTRSVDVAAVNMDVKIRNIRMKARHVKKIETIKRSANEGGESDEQQPSSKIDTDDTNGSNKEVQFTSIQNRPSDPEIAEGTTVDGRLDSDKWGKTSEMAECSNSSETSDAVHGDNAHDTGDCEKQLPYESDRVSWQNGSHNPGNSSANSS